MARSKSARRRKERTVLPPATPELLEPVQPANRFERWAPLVFVFVLGAVVYIPSYDNEFVSWDDDIYLYRNPQLTHRWGFLDIWTNYKTTRYAEFGHEDTPHQFYPLTLTIIYLEHHLYHLFTDKRLFGIPAESVGELDGRRLPPALSEAFAEHEIPLPTTPVVHVQEKGRRWVIADAGKLRDATQGYGVRLEDGKLAVYGSDPGVVDHAREATAFHLVSAVWHAVNGMLLILLLRRLGMNVWVTWVVASLFVAHPMNVASVAWGAEQKNIFALFFYLLAFMCYLRHRRRGGWGAYAGTLLLFQCALWSKTVAVTFPLVLFLTDRLLERRWDLPGMFKSAVRVAPMLALSLAASLLTVYTEDRDRPVPLVDSQRPFVAAGSIWFLALKLLAPIHQLPIYDHWNPDFNEYQRWQPIMNLKWWVPVLGLAVAAWVLFHWRKKISPHFFWGLGFYLVTQLPMMGWKNINFFQFAFVSDHYAYHGCTGVFVMLAVTLDTLRRRLGEGAAGARVLTVLVCAALAAYGAKTWVYSNVWQNAEKFWLTTLDGNPRCWAGWYNLGNLRIREANSYQQQANAERAAGNLETAKQLESKMDERMNEAIKFFTRSTEAKPNLFQAYRQLLDKLVRKKRFDEAEDCARRLEPVNPMLAHLFRGMVHVERQQWKEAAGQYEAALDPRYRGEPEDKTKAMRGALHSLRQAMLAVKGRGDCDEAIALAQRILRLRPQGAYEAYLILGICALERGDLDQAETQLTNALKLKPDDTTAKHYLEEVSKERGS